MRFGPCPLRFAQRHGAKTESAGSAESLDAVVNNDRDRAHRDRDRRHPYQDGPDASKSIVDDGANHDPRYGRGRMRAVNIELTPEFSGGGPG